MIKFQIDDELVVRELTEADAATVFTAVKDNYEHLKIFMIWSKPNYSLVDAREFVAQCIVDTKQKKSLVFRIFCADSLVGAIGFFRFDRQSGTTEIGYWIDHREEGKSIMSRACKILIDYAFDELKLNRVEIRCSAENSRSAAIPERLGFVKRGSFATKPIHKGQAARFSRLRAACVRMESHKFWLENYDNCNYRSTMGR